jgi:hypothetical protein
LDSFLAYAPTFTGGVRVATFDITGTTDVVTGAGPGGSPMVSVFDAAGTLLSSFLAFPAAFTGGVSVASATVAGEPDIVVGAGPSGSPEVAIFNATGTQQTAFFAFTPGFTGGVTVAVADIGGQAEIVAGTSSEAGLVTVYDGNGTALTSFFPFSSLYTAGVSVSIANINGQAEIAVGGAMLGGTEVTLFDVTGTVVTPLATFLPFGNVVTGPVSVSIANVNGQAEIAVGAGAGSPPAVSVFDNNETRLASFFAFDPAFTGGTSVALETLCFARGTRIATPTGDVAVEDLIIGDLVCTLDGVAEPIVWIGDSRVRVVAGRHNGTTPIIVRTNALADHVPRTDLCVTKGHSLYLDGGLIPAECLVNCRSIVWDDRPRVLDIYHIELGRHAVLIANGAPAESYRDDGNLWSFRNAHERPELPVQPPCAPIWLDGPRVDTMWRHLLERCGPRSTPPTTGEPDLHLLVDGRRRDGRRQPNGVYAFQLPKHASSVRIVSRGVVPAELGLARDSRRLGVAVSRISLWRGARLRVIEASDPVLQDGFHQFEPELGLRWTDGDATLPAFAEFTGACVLDLHVACTARYPLLPGRHRRLVACGASQPMSESGSQSVDFRYGLMSISGVPLTQSRYRTFSVPGASRPSNATTDSPIGLGRRGPRVANMPRGCASNGGVNSSSGPCT